MLSHSMQLTHTDDFRPVNSWNTTFWDIKETQADVSLETALHAWIEDLDTAVYVDNCPGWNCSPGCPPAP